MDFYLTTSASTFPCSQITWNGVDSFTLFQHKYINMFLIYQFIPLIIFISAKRHLISLKLNSSPFCASFILITLHARQGVFVYISSFNAWRFLSHLFSAMAVGKDKFCL